MAEVFATVQGEGPSTGRLAAFVRLSGCNLSCAWCIVPGMRVLRPDFSWTPVEELQVGDVVLGRTDPKEGKQGVLAPSTVTHTARRTAPLVTVNGKLTCSDDTRFWLGQNPNARSGWREVGRIAGLKAAFLAAPPERDEAEYERGYLAGMADGDGSFFTARTRGIEYRRFRLALNDAGVLARARQYAARAGYTMRPGKHTHTGFLGRGTMECLWLSRTAEAAAFERWCADDPETVSWAWGYLGGIFDAEGTIGSEGGVVRIAQHLNREKGIAVYERIARAAERCGFEPVREPKGIRLKSRYGGFWRFLAGATPAKASALEKIIGRAPHSTRVVETVEDAGTGEVVSLTTSTGNYIAEGWLLHNCDTPYTWDWTGKNGRRYDPRHEATRRPVQAVVAQVNALASPDRYRLVVTGSEPLLQGRAVAALVLRLRHEVEVETNGTRIPPLELAVTVDQWNVSPKLAHSGLPLEDRIVPGALEALSATGRAGFKFVARWEDPADLKHDLDEVAALIATCDLDARRVWIMPEGRSAERILAGTRALAQPVIDRGWHLSTRLHVLLWGDERGR